MANSAMGKVLGSECVGAQMRLLAVLAWMCQYDQCVWGTRKIPISLCSYLKAESCFFQGGDLAGKQFTAENCWKQYKSLHHLVSQSQLCQKANLDWTHESPNLLAAGIPVATLFREPHCLLTSLSSSFGHYISTSPSQKDFSKSPPRVRIGFLSTPVFS